MSDSLKPFPNCPTPGCGNTVPLHVIAYYRSPNIRPTCHQCAVAELMDAKARIEELEASLVKIEKPDENWWSCLIGPWKESVKNLPPGSDVPLRSAVRQAFLDHYGREGETCFSGWGAAPTANQHAVRNHEEVSDG
jgi:hypothetical protein